MVESNTAVWTVSYFRTAFSGFTAVNSAIVMNLSLLLFLYLLAHIFQLSFFKYFCTCTLRPFPGSITLRFTTLKPSSS